ncbi:hypothetical protein Vadar_013096 [Vaccinium darrowii]|uniref:Uncharacterized protein n=1 Tax=Vaccinium darrowii TaxID=229202 RepID=A0ACB7YL64_9ERIC|nr:hypothetical protein Vadar_013096 [Vaccinium darrowii]
MADEVVERLQKFSLTPEEEDVIVIDPAVRERAGIDCSTSLVGKLLTKRSFNRAALKDTLRRAWGAPEGLRMVDVGENLFHFRFSNEVDLQKVLNGGPWCFDGMLLLLIRWEMGMRADGVEFNTVDFWIQFWGLPFECITPSFGSEIGKRIGEVLDVNKATENKEWGRYIRVRVRIPLNRPLRRGGYVLLGAGDKCWVDYKYERLPGFCFYCGFLDHETRDCQVRCKDLADGTLKENPYGSWMAAVQSSKRGFRWKEGGRDSFARRDANHDNDLSGGRLSKDGRVSGRQISRDNLAEIGEQISQKDLADFGGQNSRLMEITDDALVAINGSEFRIGDLVPDFSKNLKIGGVSNVVSDLNRDGLIMDQGNQALGYLSEGAQSHLVGPGDTGPSLGGLDKILEKGSVSHGAGVSLIGSLDHCLNDPNQLIEVQVVKDTKEKKYQRRTSRKTSIGTGMRRPSSQANRGFTTSTARVGDKGGDAHRIKQGKRRLDALEASDLEISEGKRILLGNITNTVRVEAANPDGPPTSQ